LARLTLWGGVDSVSASRFVALAGGVPLGEAKELANLAASIVAHDLGPSGSVSVAQLGQLRCGDLQESSRVISIKG
jgi:bifunctional ADP-heptose synthase (sugar kinase/adenylyltransferase)